MKLLQILFTFIYIIFAFSIQTNGIILTSSSQSPSHHLPSSVPVSYISSAPQALSSVHYDDPGPDPLINTIPTSHISAPPSTSPSLSNAKALQTQLASASRDAHLAITISEKILKNPSTTILIRNCLGQCVQNYETIVDDLTKATNDLHANDMYLLKEDLSSIEDDISACQLCFKNMIGGQSPLQAYEDSINAIASNCLIELMKFKTTSSSITMQRNLL